MPKAKSKVKKRKILPIPKHEQMLKEFQELAKRRYDIAMAAYMAQDTATRQALDRIRDRLVIGASGVITARGMAIKVELQYIEYNAMYVATEVLKDLALLGIRVANYKFPEVFCAECGKELEKKKVSRRKKRAA